MGRTKIGTVVLLGVLAAAIAAPAASTAGGTDFVECEFDAGAGTLSILGEAAHVAVEVAGDSGTAADPGPPRIQVRRPRLTGPLPCGAETPTPTTVDRIAVRVSGSTRLTIHDPPSFAPGLTAEAGGHSEIEFEIDLGPSRQDFVEFAPEEVSQGCCNLGSYLRKPLHVRAGTRGVNSNPVEPQPDADIRLSGVEGIATKVGSEIPYEDRVHVSGAGGPALGKPLTIPTYLNGAAAADVLAGGAGDDRLSSGRMEGDVGVDVLMGGAGDDYLQAIGDSLWGAGGPSRMGGGPGRDDLRGAPRDDVLRGGRGRDLISGRSGEDRLIGGRGRDYIYAVDGVRDSVIDCGPGNDRGVERDPIDPRPISC